jgi:uncharacterized protein (TIGR02145 family)
MFKHITLIFASLFILYFASCKEEADQKLPDISTGEVSRITRNSAFCGGIIKEHGDVIIARGVCWSLQPNPTINDNCTNNGTGHGSFLGIITRLSGSTTYFVRAYAENLIGISYGETKSFQTLVSGIPEIISMGVSRITQITVESGGEVIDDGGCFLTARGVCWSNEPLPTISDNHTTDGSGWSDFSSKLSGLLPDTRYYLRAYATNTLGTAYGNEIEFQTLGFNTPCPEAPVLEDIEGNIYNTVMIGEQCWMKENLKTTIYLNGSPIEYQGETKEGASNNYGSYCWFNDEIIWREKYGALYNWNAVNNANGLCPDGWRVPDKDDWKVLSSFVTGGSIAGGDQLKSCRQVNSPLGGECSTEVHPRWDAHGIYFGVDKYGFSGVPGGTKQFGTFFYQLGQYGYWWSSSQYSINNAWGYKIGYHYSSIGGINTDKKCYFSVRCIRNE